MFKPDKFESRPFSKKEIGKAISKELPINKELSFGAYQKEVHYLVWNNVRSLLFKLYSGKEKSELFKVKYLFSYSPYTGIIEPIRAAGFDTFDDIIYGLLPTLCIIEYKNEEYIINTSMIETRMERLFIIVVNTLKPAEDFYPVDLLNDLIKEAITKSGYVGKTLRLAYDIEERDIEIKIIEKSDIRLKDIFLKDKIELEDFVNAVKNNSNGLRYLFVGEPGTGKTDTVKAIISECSENNDKLTTIVVDGGCLVPLEKIFEYASMFSPVLICIDDLDLIVGSRDNLSYKKDLPSSLQILDGFLTREDMFIIATTNERILVDKALKRPGRFDFIIEFGHLEPEFYPDLVFRETNDKKFSELFKNDSVKKELLKVKATGAFIVALVKYLGRDRFKDSKYEIRTIESAINRLYNSFKPDIKQTDEVGFNVKE